MENKRLDNDELLYLRVRNINLIDDKSKHDYEINSNGEITIKRYAFRDPRFQTSVDRACINNFEPEITKNGDIDEFRETSGVIGIYAEDINSIEPSERIGNREISVIQDKLPDNPAHAKIVAKPDFSDDEDITASQRKAQFRRLRDKEAYLATIYIRNKGWCLEPTDPDIID